MAQLLADTYNAGVEIYSEEAMTNLTNQMYKRGIVKQPIQKQEWQNLQYIMEEIEHQLDQNAGTRDRATDIDTHTEEKQGTSNSGHTSKASRRIHCVHRWFKKRTR